MIKKPSRRFFRYYRRALALFAALLFLFAVGSAIADLLRSFCGFSGVLAALATG